MLHVYGSSACSACKTFLGMAKARGVATTYHLIDQDPEAKAHFDALIDGRPTRELPLAVHNHPETGADVANGLMASMQLLKSIKE